LYTTLALPVWTVKSKDKSRLTAAEIRFMRKTAKYIWRDHKTSEKIFKVTSILDKIKSYKNDWIQHINRMPRSRLPNLTQYAPRGTRNHCRPQETPGRMRPACKRTLQVPRGWID
jgi:hypothetical protein